ncbi:hypothetical protein PseBG33_4035 [Pseudomonas synxantha BG33R]|uniref:hypothetical protein n=1 Tax=Pseudomonas synxantha TaxID=47883 RepID=UPI00025FE16E|nr:hypothetical protein [Pseudomonas synxantha]EIK72098.1 hypothetical protein PseBG33_4035 [Pseudomonas synxantha BG33R]
MSQSSLKPLSRTIGHVQLREKQHGTTPLKGWAMPIHQSHDNQYCMKITLQGPDTRHSLLLKSPFPPQTLKQNPDRFEYIHILHTNNNCAETEEHLGLPGEFKINIDEMTGRTTLDFVCSIIEKQSGLREIKGRCEWSGETTTSQISAVFRWKEGDIQYESEGWLFYSEQPNGGGAWYLVGEEGQPDTHDYRDWAIIIYSNDENATITDKTFVHLDGKSNFFYSPYFGGGYEGEYNITLTLTQDPLQCKAVFQHTIRDVVSMTHGNFYTAPSEN